MNEYLNDALSGISDEKLVEAIAGKKAKRLTFLKVASAACIVLAVAAAIVFATADKPKTGDGQMQLDQAAAAATAEATAAATSPAAATAEATAAATSPAANVGGGEIVPGGAEIYEEEVGRKRKQRKIHRTAL